MATRRATCQDVLDAPAHLVAEIVDGTLYISPRPPTLQALAKTRLSAGLGNAFGFGRGGPGGWWIMHEPELHLGEDILVPDVAGWRRERLPRIPETWDAVIAPDWVCETMSDTTRELDLNGKRSVCAREGIPPICGSSTRWSARWKPSSCTMGNGCRVRACRTTSR